MPPALIKLVATLLLIVQGLVASVGGPVLCFSLRDCDHHPLACSDHDLAAASQSADFPAAEQSAPDCGCHLHVPRPPSDLVPNTKSHTPDTRPVGPPQALSEALIREPSRPVAHRPAPPPQRGTVQARILSSMRLRI
ncbi:MAG TPA: hypothetical protein VF777_07130 [Phycisphaerales bacterium]